MTRYDVTIHDEHQAETHREVSALERNRLADFAWRHALRCTIQTHEPRTRGEGTYR